MKRLRLGVCLAALVLWLGAARASALPCAAGVRDAVEVSAGVSPDDPLLRAAIVRHLEAALRAREITLCEAVESGAPSRLSRVTIEVVRIEETVTATIRIGDAVTDKRVERTLDLTGVPGDGHALAIAVSADELLRASWAELALEDAPAPGIVPPASVQRAVERSVRPRLPPRNEVGVEFSNTLSGERTALGGRVRLLRELHAHVGVALGAEASFGRTETSEHGSVRADALGLEPVLVTSLRPLAAAWGVALESSLLFERVAFTARARPDAEASSFHEFSASTRLRVRGYYGRGPVRAVVAAGLGYAIKGARAFDERRVVTSTAGLQLVVNAGLAVPF